MQFNSYSFIIYFLPLTLIAYYLFSALFSHLGKKLVLILSSFIFYSFAGKDATIFLTVSIIVTYCLSLAIRKSNNDTNKLLLTLGIIFHILALFVFKYTGFVIKSVNSIGIFQFTIPEIILPLGISFLTFQQIIYLVHASRGTLSLHFIDYLAYILFFPKLLMGPIIEPDYLISQFNDTTKNRLCFYNIACGTRAFCYGLFKKAVLADTFAKAVSWGFLHSSDLTSGDILIVMLSYTFQIYFDFSGYCDMGFGIAQMLNITIPQNFNSPYLATSICDFWKRWHMSLTSFFTKYVYIPLGGSRCSKGRYYANVMIVFLISGLWHGANWTFILWGIMHGFLSVIERWITKDKGNRLKSLTWLPTFVIINILWLLFASDSVSTWIMMLKKLFLFQSFSLSSGIVNCFALPELLYIVQKAQIALVIPQTQAFWLFAFLLFSFFICLVPKNNYINKNKFSYISAVFASIAFIWGFICLGGESTFVYFGF